MSHRKRGPKPVPAVDRFWPKVHKTETCWLWTASRTSHGYGQFQAGARGDTPVGAHRFSYELLNGPIPAGMHVCHTCDNPPCVNPSHLFLGTAVDNLRDMRRKGRGSPPPVNTRRGEASPQARLTWEAVREIRALQAAGLMQREIATRFKVGDATVSNIVRGVTWRE